jgi:hypothetical protein
MKTQSKPTMVFPKHNRGDVKARAVEKVGPVPIYLDTEARGDDGELIMEPYINDVGEEDERQQREADPFCYCYFWKNTLNPKNEDLLANLNNSPEMTTLRRAATQCEMYVSDWDLTNDGNPIPIEVEAIIAAGVDAGVLWRIIERFNDMNRPPLEVRKKLRSSISRKVSTDDTAESTE